jgi:hypothetical protein
MPSRRGLTCRTASSLRPRTRARRPSALIEPRSRARTARRRPRIQPASLWPATVAASVIPGRVPAASSHLSSPASAIRSLSLLATDCEVPSAAASWLVGRTPESSMISNARSWLAGTAPPSSSTALSHLAHKRVNAVSTNTTSGQFSAVSRAMSRPKPESPSALPRWPRRQSRRRRRSALSRRTVSVFGLALSALEPFMQAFVAPARRDAMLRRLPSRAPLRGPRWPLQCGWYLFGRFDACRSLRQRP